MGVFFVDGLKVCVDGGDLFFYGGEDGEFSGDAGDVEGVKICLFFLGEDVSGGVYSLAEECGVYSVFDLCLLFGEEDFFGDEVFEVSHVFGADVDAGDEVGSEEVGEYVAVDFIGFDFCFGDGSGFEGVDQGYF